MKKWIEGLTWIRADRHDLLSNDIRWHFYNLFGLPFQQIDTLTCCFSTFMLDLEILCQLAQVTCWDHFQIPWIKLVNSCHNVTRFSLQSIGVKIEQEKKIQKKWNWRTLLSLRVPNQHWRVYHVFWCSMVFFPFLFFWEHWTAARGHLCCLT